MKYGCLGVLGVILFLAVIAIVQAVISDDPEMIRMRGEAVLAPPASTAVFGDACRESARLFILPSDGDVATIEVERATRQTDGTCAFAFEGDVPKADEYTFELDGVDDITIARSLIDTSGTTLVVRLSW